MIAGAAHCRGERMGSLLARLLGQQALPLVIQPLALGSTNPDGVMSGQISMVRRDASTSGSDALKPAKLKALNVASRRHVLVAPGFNKRE